MKPANHGQPWIVADMWDLAERYDRDESWELIALKLQRTPTACMIRLATIKMAFIMMHGTDADTIMDAVIIPRPQ